MEESFWASATLRITKGCQCADCLAVHLTIATFRPHFIRVHGRKRDELDMMLQTLGINAANPVRACDQFAALRSLQ